MVVCGIHCNISFSSKLNWSNDNWANYDLVTMEMELWTAEELRHIMSPNSMLLVGSGPK